MHFGNSKIARPVSQYRPCFPFFILLFSFYPPRRFTLRLSHIGLLDREPYESSYFAYLVDVMPSCSHVPVRSNTPMQLPTTCNDFQPFIIQIAGPWNLFKRPKDHLNSVATNFLGLLPSQARWISPLVESQSSLEMNSGKLTAKTIERQRYGRCYFNSDAYLRTICEIFVLSTNFAEAIFFGQFLWISSPFKRYKRTLGYKKWL